MAGAVLAGGRSRRMGQNKALLLIGGERLWKHQMRVLRDFGAAPVVLVQARGQRKLPVRERVSVIRDSCRDAGPLAGLHAALAHSRAQAVAVLAVDMPDIDGGWFAWLAEQCTANSGAVARTPNGYEPLAAIYPKTALIEAGKRLAEGVFALQPFIKALVQSKQMRVLRADQARRRQLTNWNSMSNMQPTADP